MATYAWAQYYWLGGDQVILRSGATEADSLHEAERAAVGSALLSGEFEGMRVKGRPSIKTAGAPDISYVHVRTADGSESN